LSATKPVKVIHSSSEEETVAVARALGEHLKGGDWIALVGDLGAGKTQFVRGLAEALGCQDAPSSPTFSLIHIYKPKPGPKKLPLRHADLYRLAPKDVPSLEWEDLTDEAGVTVVEWAEKCRLFWPAHAVEVRLSHQGENRRLIEFFGHGERAVDLVRKVKPPK
jgi:tRNA threonylcarbamoyladenosine biosynthesis protein TsaE